MFGRNSAAARRRRAAPGIDVWIVRLEDGGPGLERALRAALGPEETLASERFHFPADRLRALATRALARTTLSRYLDVPFQDWRFSTGPHGRPEIARPAGSGLRFNLSHTAHFVACAVNFEFDLGVDVECAASLHDPLEIAGRVCTPDELAALQRQNAADRQAAMLALWTLKEAHLKARGTGLALDPRQLGFSFLRGGQLAASFGAQMTGTPDQWWHAAFDLGGTHLLSLARRGPPPSGCRFFAADAFCDGVSEIELPCTWSSHAAVLRTPFDAFMAGRAARHDAPKIPC